MDFSAEGEIFEPQKTGARIKVWLEPPGKLLSIPRVKIVAQLLQYLNFVEESALVARNGELLTPDRRIWPNDEILVRAVGSRG